MTRSQREEYCNYRGRTPLNLLLELALTDTRPEGATVHCGTMRGSGSGSTTHYGIVSGYEDSDLIYDSD
jgi:hypothetical protein